MPWTTYDEAVELIERRFQFFPQTFRWRGHRYQVEAVEQSWTTSRPGWRRYFRVHCTPGIFDLYQDLTASTWHLRRVRWIGEPTRSVWTIARKPRLSRA
jgi:hypothetical protein